MDPALRAGGLMHLVPVGDAHPADQQAAAIVGLHGLRRVELKSAVQLVQRAVVEDPVFGVEAACHPHRRIGIEKALRFAGQPCGQQISRWVSASGKRSGHSHM